MTLRDTSAQVYELDRREFRPVTSGEGVGGATASTKCFAPTKLGFKQWAQTRHDTGPFLLT